MKNAQGWDASSEAAADAFFIGSFRLTSRRKTRDGSATYSRVAADAFFVG